MKLSKKQKRTIRKLSKNLSSSEIAKEINTKVSVVEKYISKIGEEKSKIKRVKNKIVKRDGIEKFKSFGDLKTFWKKHSKLFLILGLIVTAVYANGMNGEFISDDIPGFLNNPLTSNFWGSLQTLNIHRILYALSYIFFKTNQIPVHLSSLIIHILITFLLFTFLQTLFSKRESLFMIILFTLHPVNVEAVTWMSGRGYLIRAFYILLILIFYHVYLQSKDKKYYWISVAIFVLQSITIKSPQNLVLLPMLWVYEYFILRSKVKFKKLVEYIPFALVYITFFIEYAQRITTRVATTNPEEVAKNPYIQRFGYSIYKSLELLIAPVRLSLYHDSETITQAMLVAMYIILGLLVTYIIKNLFKKRDKYFGWVLFALASILYMLSPVQVAWFIAERYLYMASMAFAVIVVLILNKIEKDFKFKNFLLITVVLISLVYSTRVIARNMDWKTRKSLWESTINVYPNSARALNNLGDVYAKEGDFEKSVETFEKAIEIQPTYGDAIHNLGFTYLQMDEYEKAKEKFNEAYALNPQMYQALFHLAATEYELGNYQSALDYTEQAIDINPNFEPALNGRMLIQQKMLEIQLENQDTTTE